MMDIIQRLKAARQPARDLDLEIANYKSEADVPWYFIDKWQNTVTRDTYGKNAPGNPVCSLERFTASFDQASVTIPSGWLVHNISEGYGLWSVCLHRAFGPEKDQEVWKRDHHWPTEYMVRAEHADLNIAICIAGLTARERGDAQEEQVLDSVSGG